MNVGNYVRSFILICSLLKQSVNIINNISDKKHFSSQSITISYLHPFNII